MAVDDEVIKQVTSEFVRADANIKQAEGLIELLSEADENVGPLRAKLAQARQRSGKWQRALKKRGLL